MLSLGRQPGIGSDRKIPDLQSLLVCDTARLRETDHSPQISSGFSAIFSRPASGRQFASPERSGILGAARLARDLFRPFIYPLNKSYANDTRS